MSASFPYKMVEFPAPLNEFNSAILEIQVTVSNPTEPSKTINLFMQFDTGAAISLAPRSIATLLGINWDLGIPLELQGVGGGIFNTRVHILNAEIPPTTSLSLSSQPTAINRPLVYWRTLMQKSKEAVKFTLPIAIAEGEDFDLLLGMLGVIDGIAEFLCDNVNKTLWLKEYLTQPYMFPSMAQLRNRLQKLRG